VTKQEMIDYLIKNSNDDCCWTEADRPLLSKLDGAVLKRLAKSLKTNQAKTTANQGEPAPLTPEQLSDEVLLSEAKRRGLLAENVEPAPAGGCWRRTSNPPPPIPPRNLRATPRRLSP